MPEMKYVPCQEELPPEVRAKLIKDPRFPNPAHRTGKRIGQLTERHPHLHIYSETSRDVLDPKKHRSYALTINFYEVKPAEFDLTKLLEGATAEMQAVQLKIEERKQKKHRNRVRTNDIIFQLINEIQLSDWGWKLFFIRVVDDTKFENKMSGLIEPANLTAAKIPRTGQIKLFFGEEDSAAAWIDYLLKQAQRAI